MLMAQVIPQLSINQDRLKADFDALSRIGATPEGGVNRPALSAADVAARAWFASRIEDAGLELSVDEVGNMSGRLWCDNPQAPTFLLGSHLDSVENGGRYDGAIGILSALEVLRTVKESGIQLPCNLEVINFTDEEGSWLSFFGSLGFVGQLRDEDINDSKTDHTAFRTALNRVGLHYTDVFAARRKLTDYNGFLELHVEQGDRLERANVPIGIVTRILGRSTYKISFFGEAAHSATVPRNKKKDALQGAVMFLSQMYQLDSVFPQGMVNCGKVSVRPGAYNIVPEEVNLRVEIRHESEDVLKEMEARIVDIAYECAEAHKLRLNTERLLHRRVAQLSDAVKDIIENVCQAQNIGCMRMPSYAGHDAQILDPYLPCAMIFIPSVDGISHNPREFTKWEQVILGANVQLQTTLRYIFSRA